MKNNKKTESLKIYEYEYEDNNEEEKIDYYKMRDILVEAMMRGSIKRKANGNYTIETLDYFLEVDDETAEVIAHDAQENLQDLANDVLGEEDGIKDTKNVMALYSMMRLASIDLFEKFSINTTVKEIAKEVKEKRKESDESNICIFKGFVMYYTFMAHTIQEMEDKNEKRKYLRPFKEYMFKLLDMGMVEIGELEAARFLDMLDEKDLTKLYKNGYIEDDVAVKQIAKVKLGEESNTDPYVYVAKQYKYAQKKRSKAKEKEYKDFFTAKKACQMYAKGIFDLKDLEEYELTKGYVHFLDEETFLGMARQGFPNGIEFSSKEIVKQYLDGYSGHTLIQLAKLGYVNAEDLMPLLTYKSAVMNDENLAIKPKELLELYTPEVLAKLVSEEKIDTKFLDTFKKELLPLLEEEQQEEFLLDFSNKLKKSYKAELKYMQKMLDLNEAELMPQSIMQNIHPSKNTIGELYLNEQLQSEDIVALFNNSVIDVHALKEIFSVDEIIKMVHGGQLNTNALFAVSEKERASELKKILESGTLEIGEILDFYLTYDGVSIEEFDNIYRETNQLTELSSLLPDDTSKGKIRDLYVHYLISHSDLLSLKDRGIITEEDFTNFSKELSQAEFYKIFDNNSGVYHVAESIETGEERQVGNTDLAGKEDKRKNAPKITAQDRMEYFRNIGAHKNFLEMKEMSADSKEVPFRGYSVVGFPDYGLIVLENFEKWNNATYIMAHQQFMYYLNNSQKTKAIFEGTKQGLRTSSALGEAVRVKSHTKNWAMLVMDAMGELSVDAKERFEQEKADNGEVVKIAEKIAEDFER